MKIFVIIELVFFFFSRYVTGSVYIRIREKTGGQAAQAQAKGDGYGDTEEERPLSGDAQAAQAHTQSGALGGGL